MDGGAYTYENTESENNIDNKDCDFRELHLYLQIAFDLSRPVHTRFQNGGIRDR